MKKKITMQIDSRPYKGFESRIRDVYEVNHELIVIADVNYIPEVDTGKKEVPKQHHVSIHTTVNTTNKIKYYAIKSNGIHPEQSQLMTNDLKDTVTVVKSLDEIPELKPENKAHLFGSGIRHKIKNTLHKNMNRLFAHKQHHQETRKPAPYLVYPPNKIENLYKYITTCHHSINESVTADGATLLHLAAAHGDMRAIQCALDQGANINVRMAGGVTPLFLAISQRHYDAVDLLLNSGANLHLNLIDGTSPRDMAVYIGAIGIRELIDFHEPSLKDSEMRYIEGCKTDNIRLTQVLIADGVNINTLDNRGNSALLLAMENRSASQIQYLCEHGIDVNIRNRDGYTALIYAITILADQKLAAYLIQHGATFDKKILEAAWRGNLDELISFHKMYPTRKLTYLSDSCYNSAIHYAAAAGHVNVVEWLLDEGNIYANQVNIDDVHPVELAANSGHVDVVNILTNYLDQYVKNAYFSASKENLIACAQSNAGKSMLNEQGSSVRLR